MLNVYSAMDVSFCLMFEANSLHSLLGHWYVWDHGVWWVWWWTLTFWQWVLWLMLKETRSSSLGKDGIILTCNVHWQIKLSVNSWWPVNYTRTRGDLHTLTRGYAGKGTCRYGYGLCSTYPRVTRADPYAPVIHHPGSSPCLVISSSYAPALLPMSSCS